MSDSIRTKTKIISVNNKPIIIQSQITNKNQPTITLNVENGIIEDIIKEKCNNIDVFVHCYDIDGLVEEEKQNLLQDENGKKYQKIQF